MFEYDERFHGILRWIGNAGGAEGVVNEGDLRRIIREELARALKFMPEAPPVPPPPVATGRVVGGNPYLLDEDARREAEAALPVEERHIFYLRVMAARMDASGKPKLRDSARKIRARADREAKALQNRRV